MTCRRVHHLVPQLVEFPYPSLLAWRGSTEFMLWQAESGTVQHPRRLEGKDTSAGVIVVLLEECDALVMQRDFEIPRNALHLPNTNPRLCSR